MLSPLGESGAPSAERGHMLDICLLGTGGMMPLPYRYLTSLIVRFGGSSVLIDCGEGTQVTAK